MDLDPLLCRRRMTQGVLSHSGGIITNPRHRGFVPSWESVTELSRARQQRQGRVEISEEVLA